MCVKIRNISFPRCFPQTKTLNSSELSLTEDELRRANTFSWPRGERPSVQYYPTTLNPNTLDPNTTTLHVSHRIKDRPSISIEDTNLEFTEEMMEEPQKRVESNDGLLIKAVDTREKVKSIVVYNSEDEESVDGELDAVEREGEGEREREGEGREDRPEATGTELSDSVNTNFIVHVHVIIIINVNSINIVLELIMLKTKYHSLKFVHAFFCY